MVEFYEKSLDCSIPIIAVLLMIPGLALATSNAGDFAGGVAIGTGYANTYNAPTNGMIVQGSVGIGTPSPSMPLEIQGGGGLVTGTVYATASFSQNLNPRRRVLFGYDSSGQIGVVGAQSYGAASNLAFYTFNGSAWQDDMVITSGGNVGIGTTSPTRTLEVANTGAEKLQLS